MKSKNSLESIELYFFGLSECQPVVVQRLSNDRWRMMFFLRNDPDGNIVFRGRTYTPERFSLERNQPVDFSAVMVDEKKVKFTHPKEQKFYPMIKIEEEKIFKALTIAMI